MSSHTRPRMACAASLRRWAAALLACALCQMLFVGVPGRLLSVHPGPSDLEGGGSEALSTFAPATSRLSSSDNVFQVMADLVPAGLGYALSEAFTTTKDGYILRLFRLTYNRPAVPPANASQPSSRAQEPSQAAGSKPVVLLQHALLDSSAGWVLMGPDRALGFALARAGYDVWMANVRGNRFSRNHTTLLPDDPAFWSYSWDHHAAHDLPASVDCALRTTGATQLVYVGYSQGTTMALAALSTQPSLAGKISLALLLAPVGYAAHITSMPFRALARLNTAAVFTRWGVNEFGAHSDEAAPVAQRFCSGLPYACILWLQALCGANPNGNIDHALLPLIMEYLPAGTSTQNMAHWGQAVNNAGTGTNAMRMFDYGATCPLESSTVNRSTTVALSHTQTQQLAPARHSVLQRHSKLAMPMHTAVSAGGSHSGHRQLGASTGWGTRVQTQLLGLSPKLVGEQATPPQTTCNQWEYGQTEPPVYDLTAITTPLALFTGGKDSLSDGKDVELLLAAVPKGVLLQHTHYPDYAHLDFGLGTDAHERLYPDIIQLLTQHQQGRR